MAIQKVVHLHLKSEVDGRSDFYFGSIKAIFSRFDADIIGIKYKSLVEALRRTERRDYYQNKLCEIRVGTLIPNAQKNKTEL